MGFTMLIAIAVLAFLVYSLNTTHPQASVVQAEPVTPIDEAARIVRARYARGEITAEQYQRILAVLRT